jgi:hypothetical protein
MLDELLHVGGRGLADRADDLYSDIVFGCALDKQPYKLEARLGCLDLFSGMTCDMIQQLDNADMLSAPP